MDANGRNSAARPPVTVIGQRVALGPLSRTLLPHYQAWMNDVATGAWAGYPDRPGPWTDEAMTKWYEQAMTDHERLWFTVYETESWRAVGSCILREIDHRHRTAEFGLTIGDPADRGKGYGTEAVTLLLDLAFTGLGLNNVQLQIYEFNQAGLRAYQKAGFKEIGRRRRALHGRPILGRRLYGLSHRGVPEPGARTPVGPGRQVTETSDPWWDRSFPLLAM